jgi:hypothetical protein
MCRECGADFVPNGNRVFCSARCRERWYAKGPIRRRHWVVCAACGEKFLSFAQRLKFCSADCSKGYANARRHLHLRRCVTCGLLYLRSQQSSYCGQRCKQGRAKPGSSIYFLQAENGGPVKIGRSRFPEQRLAWFQTAHAERLVLRAVVAGEPSFERELHRRFADSRMLGEWFEPTLELEAEIQRYAV